MIASASALAISLKADAKAPVSYLAELDNYSYHRNDDDNYERESRHYRNVNYDRENELRNIDDNNRRYERENYRRYERENHRRYERENHRRYERENNRRYERENNRRYERENHRRFERERDWGRG
ncbi:MAG: hypothetical protein V7K83_08795 [Nostoc sp.]